MSNIDSMFPSKYMKAADLPEDGTMVPFVIEEVRVEEIGRDKQSKPVLYFKGQDKGCVANKTNCNAIAKVLGSRDTDDWIGKTIKLYSTEVQFGDEMVESIRVSVKTTRGSTDASRPVSRNQGPDDPQDDPDSVPF